MFELVDHVADALIAVTPGGVVQFWNLGAERVFGYARAEAEHRPLAELVVPPELWDEDRERLAAAAAGSHVTYEATRMRKDRATIEVDISIRAVRGAAGDLAYFALCIKDVSQHKATEAALQLAEKELESFSYAISHDLRAPLRGMNGFAQILLEDFGDKLPAEAVEYLRDIRDNAVRMSNQIDALLALSRVSRSELRREEIDLGSLARRISDRIAAADPGRTVELVTSGDLVASADPALALTLLESLLDNAWKFTRRTAQPRVELGEATADGARTFYITDNGAGFDMAFADRMFGAFQRLHPERDYPGIGIGLAMAQRIVHRHGGRISAEGKVGGGATFRFTLAEGPP